MGRLPMCAPVALPPVIEAAQHGAEFATHMAALYNNRDSRALPAPQAFSADRTSVTEHAAAIAAVFPGNWAAQQLADALDAAAMVAQLSSDQLTEMHV